MDDEAPTAPARPAGRAGRLRTALVAVGVLVAIAVVATLVVGAGGSRSGDRPASSAPSGAASGDTSGASGEPPGAAPPNPGVTFGSSLDDLPRRRLDRTLEEVVELGARWVRIDLSWTTIEPTRGRRDWAATDRVVAAARRHGLDVLALLSYTPAWARERGCAGFACPPARPGAFADFAADAAERYAARGVRTVQIWNSPNVDEFWRRPDAERYGALLRASATAIRDQSPGTKVLSGSLAFTGGVSDSRRIAPEEFLRTACAGDSCPIDALAYDPFTYPLSPSDPAAAGGAWSLLDAPADGDGLRAALAAVGLPDLPVWITSFGAPTRYAAASDPRLVDEEQQARILVDGARLAARERDTVGAFFVNTLRDRAARGEVDDHFGVVTFDGRRKPAFVQLQRIFAGPAAPSS